MWIITYTKYTIWLIIFKLYNFLSIFLIFLANIQSILFDQLSRLECRADKDRSEGRRGHYQPHTLAPPVRESAWTKLPSLPRASSADSSVSERQKWKESIAKWYASFLEQPHFSLSLKPYWLPSRPCVFELVSTFDLSTSHFTRVLFCRI